MVVAPTFLDPRACHSIRMDLRSSSKSVEGFVDDRWDRLNLGSQILLNLVEVETVVIGDEINSEPEVAETARTPDTVQIGLSTFREIEIDHHVDGWNIDPTCEEIRRDKIAARAVPKIVEYAVAMGLQHLRVDVEAGKA